MTPTLDNGKQVSRALFSASTFLFWMALYLYVPILPVYAESLGASLSMVGVVISSYAIAQLGLRIPIGVWADAMGRRKFLVVAGVGTITVGALGLGLAPNAWLLFLARTVTGVGAATWVAFTVLFASYFARQQTGRAIGIINFVNGIALVTATASGGVIAEVWGPRATFFGAAVLGLASLAAVAPVREPSPSAPRPFSWPAFVRVATDPLLLTVSFMGMLAHFATFASVFGFIPVHADRIGATSSDLGVITMLALGSAAPAALGTVFVAQRWGYPMTIRVGAVLMSGALLGVPFIHHIWLLELAQVVNGAGRGLLTTVFMALSIRTVASEERATAMGVYQALYAVGMMTGPLASGFLAHGVGLESVFYLSAALCIIPAGMSFMHVLPRY